MIDLALVRLVLLQRRAEDKRIVLIDSEDRSSPRWMARARQGEAKRSEGKRGGGKVDFERLGPREAWFCGEESLKL